MKTIEINGSARQELGKKSSKVIRKSGNVPCVIYGEEKNIHFYAEEASFKNLIYTPEAHFVTLNLEGKRYTLVLKEAQFHPVTDRLLHADFVQVFEDKPVTMNIPVRVFGDSAAVRAGAKLIVKKRYLKIKALPKDLPENISIDISKLKLNESIRVGNIDIPNLEFLDMKSVAIVTVSASRVSAKSESDEEVEETEGAEGQAEGTDEEKAEQ
jgi:large subunit ribosomal protein L25